jgi:hypothetical protein
MELFMNTGSEGSDSSYLLTTSVRSVVYAIAIKIFKAIAYSLIIL